MSDSEADKVFGTSVRPSFATRVGKEGRTGVNEVPASKPRDPALTSRTASFLPAASARHATFSAGWKIPKSPKASSFITAS